MEEERRVTTDAGWIITVLRRDGEEGEEGRAYEMVLFWWLSSWPSSMTALKAGRDVTIFPAKFWNLDH